MNIQHCASVIFTICILGLGQYVNIVAVTTISRSNTSSLLSPGSSQAVLQTPSNYSQVMSIKTSKTELPSWHSTNTHSIVKNKTISVFSIILSSASTILTNSTSPRSLSVAARTTLTLLLQITPGISSSVVIPDDNSSFSTFSLPSITSSFNVIPGTSKPSKFSSFNISSSPTPPITTSMLQSMPVSLSSFSSVSFSKLITSPHSSLSIIHLNSSSSSLNSHSYPPFVNSMSIAPSLSLSTNISRMRPSSLSASAKYSTTKSYQPSPVSMNTTSIVSSLSLSTNNSHMSPSSLSASVSYSTTQSYQPSPVSIHTTSIVSSLSLSINNSQMSPSSLFASANYSSRPFLSHSLSSQNNSLSPTYSLSYPSQTRLHRSSTSHMLSQITRSRSLPMDSESVAFTSTSTAIISKASNIKVPSQVLKLNGILVVTLKDPSKSFYNLKNVSKSIEIILDKVFGVLQGYMYSKVLLITQRSNGRFECPFKIFIKEPSNETSGSLKIMLEKYNNTKGFGKFALHSVVTFIDEKPHTKRTIKLWTIIVIAVLGFMCLLLVIVLLLQQRRIRKIKTENENGNVSTPYPSFDALDEQSNIPLKLIKTRASTTESTKPLKSESASPDSANEEDPDQEDMDPWKTSDHGSRPESSDSSDDNASKKEQVVLDGLQINEVKDGDETKYSTFSRKN